jgi:UDP-N-acetylmuramoyl-L-alanyl-D-glutamate--2,6-diaminopimelate ligase
LNLTELMSPAALSGPAASPGTIRGPPLADPEIVGLTADSRQVRPGFLFAALRGAQQDGRAFAAEAVAKGAVAILTDDEAALNLDADARRHIAIIADPNPHRRLALLAARFHARQPHTIAAVTGTNGKTSVVHFTREIWAALGHPAASLGTLGLVSPAGRRKGALTTPDPVALQRDLAELAAQGVEHVAIEASSHGLAQYRLDGVAVTAAAFTNLTRDHLDYHGDMTSYRAAKQRLFAELLARDGTAILNADSPEFAGLAALCRGRGQRVIAYGTHDAAELRLLARAPSRDGQRISLRLFGETRGIDLPLVGEFQAMNVLAALGLAVATGTPVSDAVNVLSRLSGVPGRMQRVGETASGAVVFVDYAHTPDALAIVLAALRPHAEGRLAIVFGAGGDRDRGKRPLMAQVATEGADLVYVTDDNPRSESPAEIRRAILAAAPHAIEIGDRSEAIAAAVAGLRRGDILVIAGKGHETGQIIGGTVLPFDDALVAREAIASAGGG